jgi:hypothetical protein
MMLNDSLGDCVCAGAGHAFMDWTANAGQLWTPSDSDILALYRVFNPGTEDDGCDMQQVLAYLKTTGLAGHRINDFAILNAQSQAEAMDAINLFGGLDIGVALPDSVVQSGDLLSVPWDTPGALWVPNPDNGHCIWGVAYDGSGLTVVSWGALKHMSWEFYAACCEESYALDAPDWFTAAGPSPGGYTSDQLNADLPLLPTV